MVLARAELLDLLVGFQIITGVFAVSKAQLLHPIVGKVSTKSGVAIATRQLVDPIMLLLVVTRLLLLPTPFFGVPTVHLDDHILAKKRFNA